ncbi:unnamed protein product, partial [Hapterophycus canaliculatus]
GTADPQRPLVKSKSLVRVACFSSQVCFERKIDCTLVPCGHHCCCLTCAAQFEQCPVCRADVEQKIRAISV